MRKGGLEPPRIAPHAPQTCASTNSATSARDRLIVASGWGGVKMAVAEGCASLFCVHHHGSRRVGSPADVEAAPGVIRGGSPPLGARAGAPLPGRGGLFFRGGRLRGGRGDDRRRGYLFRGLFPPLPPRRLALARLLPQP